MRTGWQWYRFPGRYYIFLAYHIGPRGATNLFLLLLPLSSPARGVHIYAYAYICTSLLSAFVTFSFSHKAPIRVHLRARMPPSISLVPVRLPFTFFLVLSLSLSLSLLGVTPHATRNHEWAKERNLRLTWTPLSRFIPTVTDIIKREETITRVQIEI